MEDLKKGILVRNGVCVGAVGDKNFSTLHVGCVIPFAGNTDNIPHGYLLADGASYKVADYPDLYAVIGNTYGGDSTNFNVPNLVDKFIQGSNTSGTEKEAGLPNIEGKWVGDYKHAPYLEGTMTGAFSRGEGSGTKTYGTNEGGGANEFIFDASKSNPIYGNSDTVQPPALTMVYIIKAFHTNEGQDDGVVEQIEQINNKTNQLSNPNLIDNPDFSINQRGLTEYQVSSKAYTVDRWKTANVPALIIPGDKQITIQRHPSQSSSFSSLGQIVEKLSKGTYTFSIDIISADESVPTIVMRAMDWADIANGVSGTYYAIKSIDNSTNSAVGRHSLTFTLPEDKENVYIYIYGSNLATEDAKFTIANAKLEAGKVPTPFVAPHPAEELVKCQRYYKEINGMYSPYAVYTNSLAFSIPNAFNMASTTPNITFKNDNFTATGTSIRLISNASAVEGFSGSLLIGADTNCIVVNLNKNAHGLNKDDICLVMKNTNPVCLSAEL